jgi:hypothetical protein
LVEKDTQMKLIDTNHKAASIAMLLMGISMVVLYPKNLWIGQHGWVWDYPSRHLAFEHMLIAVYATLGMFLIWGARDPIRYLPLTNFTIVSGIVHGTAMWVDALRMAGMESHLGLRGDVVGTYLAPVILTVFHARLPLWKSNRRTAAAPL